MSSYFFGNYYILDSYINQTQFQNGTLTGSTITNTRIDMNNQTITNVQDPQNQQDAATKKYVDDLNIQLVNVNLLGTTGTQISTQLQGCVQVMVKNQIMNGPSAIFNLTKNEQTQKAQINRITATPGLATGTQLKVQWNQNQGIFLQKTNGNYDGSYRIKINQV